MDSLPVFDDTIAAISTPIGEGGLGVVRLSGPRALEIADRVFVPGGRKSVPIRSAASHTVQYGHIVRAGQVIDETLVAIFHPPRTFTKELMVEISCHGGIMPTKLVLDALLAEGARLAHPGEFTKRAFLNGRIDLAQAEAVADLIHSRTELSLAAANEQLAGKLSARINKLRDELIIALAHIEAHIDFPDEDIAPDTHHALLARLEAAIAQITLLLRTANEGQILRRGVRAAIVGRPNAGKSSLLNQLLGRERAIVSPIAGTTRDTIEETANIGGLPIVFIDTAGLRSTGDELELEGMRRSRESLARAELIIHVLDGSEPPSAEDLQFLREFEAKKRVLVANKSDRPRRLQLEEPLNGQLIWLSALSGDGLAELKDAIRSLFWSGQITAESLEVMINSRHQDALNRAKEALGNTHRALASQESLEFVAVELRIAVSAIGEIVGKTTTEDLLDSIFSQFCLGK
ncbi:MAG TPA: tRNA uridine-5-carboxymethylaminomethyl(34) synthesis GTPase MnmE [Methylomirabilota bacterium]|nr:tRNA uridine-5-carboxymethylaminomethyl(34) synthesis GTPase MnmE [Methylomirabilota bacterium]